MVANIRGYTPNYGFKLINFDTPRWHTLEYANWGQLDAMFLQFGAGGLRGQWLNATEYLPGERVFDGDDSAIYRCLINHTSAPTGTFAEDRLLHPTYWSLQLGGVPVYRGDWMPGIVYTLGDIVNVDYAYYLCTFGHVSQPAFPGIGEEWQTIFDATEAVTDATDAADAAANSASSAFTSANNAQSSENDAETAAQEAAASAYIASSSQGAFRWNFDINTAMGVTPGIADIQFNNANWSLANRCISQCTNSRPRQS